MSWRPVRRPRRTVAWKSDDWCSRCCSGNTRAFRLPGNQAVSDARPLPRRADTIARPARVRMRRRKPCTRARRRLFGWNVRLPLATVVLLEISAVPRTAGGVLMVASSANSSSVATRAGERQDRSTHVAGDRSRVLTASNEVKPRYPGDGAPVTMTRLDHDDDLAEAGEDRSSCCAPTSLLTSLCG